MSIPKRTFSQEAKETLSRKRKGKPSSRKGKKLSDATRKVASEQAIRIWQDDKYIELRYQVHKAKLGRKIDVEQKASNKRAKTYTRNKRKNKTSCNRTK